MTIGNSILTIDKFIDKALYDKYSGYYNKKTPFGKMGDFITAPKITSVFSEMISLWMISYWSHLGKPNNFSIVELGPGDGSFCKTLIAISKKFPEFRNSINIYMFEISHKLSKIQKNKIRDRKVKWIKNFNKIEKGPVVFFGNEFFDAIPIKQFEKKRNKIYERCVEFRNNKFKKFIYKKISKKNSLDLIKYNLNNNKGIIEYPKRGFEILDILVKKIKRYGGGLLLIDYGINLSSNRSTLQSVKSHKKNKIFENIGDADITHLVDFSLLKKFLTKNKLSVRKIVSQSFFLKRLGIIERANNLSNKMTFSEKSDIYYRIERLISPKKMGDLFKVIFASHKEKKFNLGFE